MSLLKLATGDYPVSFQHVRDANPNVTFPAVPTDADLLPFGYANVRPTARPSIDPRTQRLEAPSAEPDGAGGYRELWTWREATPAEIAEWDEANRPPPDWSSFAIEINQNPIVAAWRDALPIGPFGLLVGGTAVASLGKPETLMAVLAQLKASGALPEPVQQVLKEQATAKSLPNEIIQIFS